jgi:TolA-binding protein
MRWFIRGSGKDPQFGPGPDKTETGVTMTTWLGRIGPKKAATMSALAVVLIGTASPAFAQDTLAEARLRKMEAEIRALQRQVFPGGDGKYFAPEITPGQPAATGTPPPPASTPMTDLLTRMDSVEAQIQHLTAQVEQTSNRLTQLEARVGPAPTVTPAPTASPAPAPGAATDSNLAAMNVGASASKPAPASPPAPTPVSAHAAKPAPAHVSAAPSPQRVTAVRAIEKPATEDPGDDEYSYGYRLWDAKFYPEAEQQLKMFVERYPHHQRMSYARNLLGRAYLDDGKPREAASWFLQNYQSDKAGARAPDSLLLLAESMHQLKDTSRACIALAEFGETYSSEAAGRLKSQYDATRAEVTCNK